MTLRQYLLVMLLGTALSWTAVWLIVTMIDPEQAQAMSFIIFYASLFLALTGTFSVLGFVSRVFVLKKFSFVAVQVAISFRQAIMLSTLITLSLFLESKDLLHWWNIILLVILLTVLESFFVTAKVRK